MTDAKNVKKADPANATKSPPATSEPLDDEDYVDQDGTPKENPSG